MRTPLTQFRIPSDLKEQFKKICERKGLTMADVVKELIEEYVLICRCPSGYSSCQRRHSFPDLF